MAWTRGPQGVSPKKRPTRPQRRKTKKRIATKMAMLAARAAKKKSAKRK